MRTNLIKLFKTYPNYSYSKFIFFNPHAGKERKIKAIKKFLDNTRK